MYCLASHAQLAEHLFCVRSWLGGFFDEPGGGLHFAALAQIVDELDAELVAERDFGDGVAVGLAVAADRRKIQYELTEKGAALLPTMLALRQWGERWETGFRASPVLVDKRDMRPIAPIDVRAWDGRVLTKHELLWALPEDVDYGENGLRAAE